VTQTDHTHNEETVLDQRVFFLEPEAHRCFLALLDAPPGPQRRTARAAQAQCAMGTVSLVPQSDPDSSASRDAWLAPLAGVSTLA
jgi:hypothetical protein